MFRKFLALLKISARSINQGIACCLAIMFLPWLVFGQMSSSNFSIPADSLNFGGNRSSSTNYVTEDTLGEIATGYSDSTNYTVQAGYQQLDTYPISLSINGTTTLPSIGGLGADSSSSTVTATVETRNPAGYELSVRATTDPALQSASDEFSDYSPVGSDPDYSFTVAASEAAFGFSPEGNDITSRYQDNGATCNSGSNDNPNACWDGFDTTGKVIATKAAPTDIGGNDTDIVFQAAIGSSVVQTPGEYNATIEVTATSL